MMVVMISKTTIRLRTIACVAVWISSSRGGSGQTSGVDVVPDALQGVSVMLAATGRHCRTAFDNGHGVAQRQSDDQVRVR